MVDRKASLLNFAEQAVRTRGFDGFSFADLAQAAGIRKASVHYHFPTKADLSVTLMDRYHHDLTDARQRIVSNNPTAAGRLLGLIDLYRSALGDGTSLCLCVALVLSKESLAEDVSAKIVAFRSATLSWIEDVFELGCVDGSVADVLNPRSEARATLAILEGALIAARANEDLKIFDDTLTLLSSRCRMT